MKTLEELDETLNHPYYGLTVLHAGTDGLITTEFTLRKVEGKYLVTESDEEPTVHDALLPAVLDILLHAGWFQW